MPSGDTITCFRCHKAVHAKATRIKFADSDEHGVVCEACAEIIRMYNRWLTAVGIAAILVALLIEGSWGMAVYNLLVCSFMLTGTTCLPEYLALSVSGFFMASKPIGAISVVFTILMCIPRRFE